MTPADRFEQCKALCLSDELHNPESLAQYNAERAREYARAEARRSFRHPQQPFPGVA